ncbi:MAG: PIN domain-containing protein [Betaproteobacteria bacterium]|nr:PIN domain-containing protein [Betaproteobacteria bacterium]MBI2961190.1 PIN domain-containing protein [Betaproteobacteria bacterium]
MARALVDTGAIVALVNRADRFHDQAAAWFQNFRGQLLSTEPVITESAYVLAASPEHQRAALLWVQRARVAGILQVVALEDHAALARIMSKYADLPCDYADASLIWLAEKTGVLQIATIDQGDFSVYRVRGRRRFRILIA